MRDCPNPTHKKNIAVEFRPGTHSKTHSKTYSRKWKTYRYVVNPPLLHSSLRGGVQKHGHLGQQLTNPKHAAWQRERRAESDHHGRALRPDHNPDVLAHFRCDRARAKPVEQPTTGGGAKYLTITQ
eukprot:8857-Amorphochlora_amoeboformis.AAC.1